MPVVTSGAYELIPIAKSKQERKLIEVIQDIEAKHNVRITL